MTDEAHLHLTGTSGEILEEEGPATGALPGKVRARFVVGSAITGSFTFYPRGGGSISGHGSARLHSTGTVASFGGSLTVSHGTGRYAHARGHGGLYGLVYRHANDSLTVQTTGRLSY
ncbi:MAG: autotransporter [Solirubrobacteraceae bacterium]